MNGRVVCKVRKQEKKNKEEKAISSRYLSLSLTSGGAGGGRLILW